LLQYINLVFIARCILVRFLVRHFLQMGGSTSKPTVDSGVYLRQAEEQLKPLSTIPEAAAQAVQAQALQAKALAEQAAAAAEAQSGRAWFYLKSLGIFVGIAGLILAILYLIDYIGITYYNRSIIGLLRIVQEPASQPTPDKSTAPTDSTKSPPASSASTQKIEFNPVFNQLYNLVTGSAGSGDLLPKLQDATKQSLIPGSSAPLSSDTQGAYGMQVWMFVKDWNYGFGKEKIVLSRADPTNQNVLNPKVSLHPTDNTLKVSVSIFPDSEGSAGKTEPAPAASGGSSTDDVFTCEVPNIPLQSWFSLGVSVFGRNLDIYIDGKLVKSCFLPGVPKPATGDITLSPSGGFSGYLCNFNYYARMLTPGDAANFHGAGTTCQNKVPTNGTGGGTAGTGYAVKFGVYDMQGKEVQEYTF
jgi:hypothetical protein